MRVAGIDDAGRGAVLGPLVIAGIVLDNDDLPHLAALKVKDSKLLSRRTRERLAPEIEKIALKCHFVEFSPADIDRIVNFGKKLRRLNWLEACGMAEVILNLRADVAFVDASDVIAERFKDQILERIPFRVGIVSEHKADRNYPIVSAASILAKVRRDKAISELRQQYGDLGSGYVADEKTMNFLETWINTYGSYPDFVRKSWKPAKKFIDKLTSTQLKII